MPLLVDPWVPTWSSFLGGQWGIEFRTTAPSRITALQSRFLGGDDVTVYLAELSTGTILRQADIPATASWEEAAVTPLDLPPGDYVLWVATNKTRDGDETSSSFITLAPGFELLRCVGGMPYGSVPDMTASTLRPVNARFEGVSAALRIRSHLSEDAGSIFAATQAVAVELGISEAFDYGENVPAGVLRSFSEALTPELVALRYWPLPTRNREMLTIVDGETNLGRLANSIPPALMLPATSIPGESGGLVTAQQAIQHVVDSWSAQFPWLAFEPVPDLRYVLPGAVGAERQYYLDYPTAGILTTAAVVIPQEQDARRSMREILDEFLAIFPGTIVRQDSAGRIELVPRVGPDAPEDVALTLTWDDLLAISDGEDDPRGVINRCRVTSQGWEFTENQALRSPAFVVSIGGMGIERSVLDSEEVLPEDSVEEFQPGHTIPFTVLVDAGNTITVDVVLTAFGSWNRSTASAFSTEGTHSASLTLSVGQSQQVSITHNSRSQNVTATWRVTRVSSVAIDIEPLTIPSWADNFFGRTYFAYLAELDVTGTAWVRTNEAVTSEFGRVDQVLPGPDGTDALVTSRAAYGERQASIQSNVFQLTPEQAQNIAQSYVLWNINPRTIRDVQQSEWEKYPVKFDHIGRLIELPNGEVAVVENRDYTDAFQPLDGAMASTFSATVTEVVIDTSTDWLLLDNGDFMQLDSGDLLEVS